jgi:hypothetical protein
MRSPVLAFVVLASLLSGCGGSDSPAAPPTPPPTTLPSVGRYSLTVTPNPILATASGDPNFPWAASWRVTVQDTAGLEGDLNREVTTARNNFGFTFTVHDYSPNDFIAGIGTSHIPHNGTLSYTTGMSSYRADGNGGQQLILTIAAEVIDARGNHSNISTDVRVTGMASVPLK